MNRRDSNPMGQPEIDWLRVEELFYGAHAMPASAVDAWLESQTRGDPATREEVRSLLAAERRHAILSETAEAAEAAAPAPAAAPMERLERVGPYQPLRMLGRGGMGVVYLAQRADGQFEQTVALKLIAAHIVSDDVLRRFRTERQLLARLAHPNITRLLDGGVAASGEPYLVMEYVEGQPLDRYCDEQKLPIEARLDLFLQVCEAVDFAHRSMVLHRDLKPGNVLVTPDGTVKLLDFGTASLIGGQSASTVVGTRMITPRYASPEQLRGDPPGIAADVFSLGVVLYELLTGAWPFGDPESIVSELQRTTADASPAVPASAISEDAAAARSVPRKRLQRLLRGDLAAIVLKALENDPRRRYGTVHQFAEDIRRFRDGAAVQARPQTAVYRWRKLVRRHWLPVTVAAVFVGAIAAAALVAAYEARAARAEAVKAEQVNLFLSDMLSSAGRFSFDPQKYTVAEMLDAADQGLQKHKKNDPFTEALMRLNLAASYYALARFDRARFHLERAIPVFRASHADRELATAFRLEGGTASLIGQYDAAAHLYQESLACLARLGKNAPPAEVFVTKSWLAELLSLAMQKRPDEARKLYRELLETGARDATIPRTEVARAMANWAGMLRNEGKEQEAEAMLQNALAMGRKEDPGGLWQFGPLYNLTVIRGRKHDYTGAREFARQMVEVSVRSVGPDHTASAQSKLIWARFAAETGDTAAAVEYARQAMPVIEKGYPPPSLELWHASRDAAHVMRLAGKRAEAERYARQSLAVAVAAHLAQSDPRLANSWEELGRALCGEAKYAAGIQALTEAAAVYRRSPPEFAQSADAVEKLIRESRRRVTTAGR